MKQIVRPGRRKSIQNVDFYRILRSRGHFRAGLPRDSWSFATTKWRYFKGKGTVFLVEARRTSA
jgi:hypothetical protein